MILIGLGANLTHPIHGSPRATLEAALASIAEAGAPVTRRSRWYRSAPVPASDQPWFVNAVASLRSDLGPKALLELLHEVEASFGRVRRERNEPRVVDLDLLSYGDLVSDPSETPVLPHPRLAERAFVLLPLAELAPDWHHPRTGVSVAELCRRLPPEQTAEPFA
ncbi:MAG: 2-amino-4-hydroxy-6-hydroxymethyldihydropteridine diphosphokinase [Kiloniellales bacterium]|nr:2-amino-4-hydroxy-6-hydroxymethyldihydropteridine diphosphokinase [Kiloniellales bacterium]